MKIVKTIIILFIFLCGCSTNNKKEDVMKIKETSEKKEVIVEEPEISIEVRDKLKVSRGLVAKMIALTFNDMNSVNAMDREISFIDTDKDKWYDKYINTVRVQKYMLGDENSFRPEEPLTVLQAQGLIDNLDKNNTLKIKMTDENKNNPISYALWIEFYKSMLQNISTKSVKDDFLIEEKNIIVLATPDNNKNLNGWNLIADTGPFSFEGIEISHYIDKEIKVLVKENEILAVVDIVNETPEIKNCYIVKNDSDSVTIFSGGVERTYDFYNNLGDVSNKICDIVVDNGNGAITKIYDDKIISVIKKVDYDFIELDGIGKKEFSKDVKLYSVTDGTVKWKNISNLTVGTDIAYYVLKDGLINAGVITKKSKPLNIRVAISTTDFKSLYHENISISATDTYTVRINGETKEYKSSDVFKLNKNDDIGRIEIRTKSETGKIKINSIKRNWPNDESPLYRGTIEISKEEEGFVIINELNIDEYLYAVVPSEMPTSYGLEASKVQAVTARSYAYNQYYANRFHKYGANVDDSISCQVYNNIPENEVSIEAVNDTKGLCITYKGDVITANFFSTSSGYTANSGEVWANLASKQFPSTTTPYLSAKKQFTGKDCGDLSIEENAEKFFKDTGINCFDSNFAWFRWNLTMTKEELSASINNNLKERYKANPSLIKTLQEDGFYRTKGIETIGEIKDIQVMERGEAGNIMQLKIVGTKAVIMVYTEYNIRFLIRPQKYLNEGNNIKINLKDGTVINNYNVLPSGFFVIDKQKDGNGNLEKATFYGGGNGHGVGMSQNGVKGMIDKGYSFEDIIKHYFSDVEIVDKI